jgi:type III secretion protein D
MNAPFAPIETVDWTLRVLNGRLAGAERRLPRGKYLSVGHGLNHDIVLRGKDTSGISLELHLAEEQAYVRVVAGQIELLGRPVGAGEDAILPPFVPLHIGEYAVAIGNQAEARWDEAERLGRAVVAPSHGPTEPPPTERAGLIDRVTTRLYPIQQQLTTGSRSMWGVLAAGTLMLGVALGGPMQDLVFTPMSKPQSAQSTLASLGFSAIKVTGDAASETLIISGTVKSEQDAARLRKIVDQRFPGALIDVTTMTALAAAATDILSGQKVDAVAKAGVRQSIVVEAEYLPLDRQAELTTLLKRDLPALSAVTFQMDGRRGDRDLQYFFSSSSNGLATFVDGAPGYIVTADQARWFEGSIVPTGHKIVSIGNGRIIFERNGQLEELSMMAGPASPQPASMQ